jgi:hypothetical protein
MQSAVRHGAVIVAIMSAVGLVAAHQVGLDIPIAGQMFSAETTGSIDRADRPGWIQLSDEQRGFIFLGVMNLPDAPEADVAAEVTDVLPASVELQDMPAMVTRKVALVRGHKFVKLDDRILVVRSSDRVVVSEIPRYRLVP